MSSWINRFGLNVHTTYPDYRDLGKVMTALALFGITPGNGWVRNNDWLGPQKLAGYNHIVVIDTYDDVAAGQHAKLAIAAAKASGAELILEGLNEPDPNKIVGGNALSTFAAQVRKANQAIIIAAAGQVPVMCSSLGMNHPDRAAAIGYQPGISKASIHPYRADLTDQAWQKRINDMLADAQVMAPFMPVTVTETGLWVATSTPNIYSHHPTDPQLAISQLVPNIKAFFSTGVIERVIYYELLNVTTAKPPNNLFGLAGDGVNIPPHGKALAAVLTELAKSDADVPPAVPDPRDAQITLLQGQLWNVQNQLTAAQAKVANALKDLAS